MVENLEARISGSIYGKALGDAWGYQTEFMRWADIKHDYPRGYPFPLDKARITDDTQMALYLTQALKEYFSSVPVDTFSEKNLNKLEQTIINKFLLWLDDNDNNRAPGVNTTTVLRAIQRANQSAPGMFSAADLTSYDSKGCGANMKADWIGLDGHLSGDSEIAKVAKIQSFITHAHPTAITASVVTALLARDVLNGYVSRGEFSTAAADLCAALPSETFSKQETEQALRTAHASIKTMKKMNWQIDPCDLAGQGWVAEQTLAVVCLIIDSMPEEDPHDCLMRAAMTNGDSDSIGAITGGLLGATGVQWNEQYINALEDRYKKELNDAKDYYVSSWQK